METFGKLKVRVFINDRVDQHGRVSGSWKTLMSRWTDRENVEQLLETFRKANPELHLQTYQMQATFETREDLMM